MYILELSLVVYLDLAHRLRAESALTANKVYYYSCMYTHVYIYIGKNFGSNWQEIVNHTYVGIYYQVCTYLHYPSCKNCKYIIPLAN